MKPGHDVYPRPGLGLLQDCLKKTLALRVLHGARDLALSAADAALRIARDFSPMGDLLC